MPPRPNLLVKACLNGGLSRADHPAVPSTPAEIAADAAAAARAGAGAVHVHPRSADGHETLDRGICAEIVRAVRAAAPGLAIGFTTGAWIETEHERRRAAIAAWDPPPDFASVNFSEEGTLEICRTLLERGIGVEAGLTTLADARAFLSSGIMDRALRALVEPDDPEPKAAAALARAIDRHLESRGFAGPRLHHGRGRSTWAVVEQALERGRDVRIGLEDTLEHADGARARDNADLVAAVLRMAERIPARIA